MIDIVTRINYELREAQSILRGVQITIQQRNGILTQIEDLIATVMAATEPAARCVRCGGNEEPPTHNAKCISRGHDYEVSNGNRQS